MRVSSPITFASRSPSAQHRLTDSVLRDELMQEEIRIGLTGPLHEIAHGSKAFCPHLAMTVKNIDREAPTNHVHETLTTILLAQLYLKGLEVARRFPRKLDAILCVRNPLAPVVFDNIDDLNELETQLQAAFDQIQIRLWRKDYSTRTMKDALDTLYEIRKLVDRMIEWFEKRLYGKGGVQ